MSNSNFLTVDKLYKSKQKLKKSHLDAAFDSIQSWANKNINDNNQFRKDIFGGNYTFDQDGYANLESPIFNLNAGSANTGTSDLNWEFTGSVTLPQTFYVNQVNFDYTILFSNSSAARNITFADPGGHDSVVYLNATQTLSNKTLVNLTVSSPLNINSSAGVDSILNFKNNGATVSTVYWDNATGDLRIKNANGFITSQLNALGVLQINGVNGALIAANASANTNAYFALYENSSLKWTMSHDNTTDYFKLTSATGVAISVQQNGWMVLNGLLDDAKLTIDSYTAKDSHLIFKEFGAIKWDIFNDHTTGTLSIEAPGNKSVDIKNNGEVLLEDVDPPTANYANRNSIVAARLRYTDDSGVVPNSYNIASVTDDDGDGEYLVAFDTDFNSGSNYSISLAAANSGANFDIFGTWTSGATSSITVSFYDISGAARADTTFDLIAIGPQ